MRVLVEQNRPDELGKAVPTASAKWIAHWAKMSIEGTPGEYAGREDTDGGLIRVIDVTDEKAVNDILRGTSAESEWDTFWPSYSDPDPSLWLVDRKSRPDDWWQREDELGIFANPTKPKVARKTSRRPASRSARATQRATKPVPASIVRVPPEEVQAIIDELGLTKPEAAAKLGISGARINELTTHTRPGSWLNAERLDWLQQALRA
jgi:predicted DNA-binding protein (UPF0251 family)